MKLPQHIERRMVLWLATNKIPPTYQSLAEFMYNLLVQPNNDTLNVKRNTEAYQYSKAELDENVKKHALTLAGLDRIQYLQEVSYFDGFDCGVALARAQDAERIESHNTLVLTMADLMIANGRLTKERQDLERTNKRQSYALIRLSNETLKTEKMHEIAKEGLNDKINSKLADSQT